MAKIRIAITIDEELLPKIDKAIKKNKYVYRTRSQFIDTILKEKFEKII